MAKTQLLKYDRMYKFLREKNPKGLNRKWAKSMTMHSLKTKYR